jgi:hypothetical protein
VVITTSDGDTAVELSDQWVVTGQGNPLTGTCCTYDPRLGHILQGPGGAVTLASISFPNGDDNPYWAYSFRLDPGETGIIMNFAVAQPSKAAAAAKAAEIAALPAAALQYMSDTEKAQVLNFAVPSPDRPQAAHSKDVRPLAPAADGKPDILFRYQPTGDLVVWYMDGVLKTGGAALSQKPASTTWVPVGVGDFGSAPVVDKDLGPLVPTVQDGKPDILFRNTATGDLVVWYMDGVIRSGGAALSQKPGSTSWVPIGVADFGSAVAGDKVAALRDAAIYDGKPDILFRNTATGDLVVWYMDGVIRTGGAALSPSRVATGWQLAALGDYNQDGRTDIVWQYPATGDIVVWYMDGVSKMAGAATNPPKVAVPWQIIAPR